MKRTWIFKIKNEKVINFRLVHLVKIKFSFNRMSKRIRLESALDLHRRLPPDMIERNLSNMIDLVPELCEDLLEKIDQPLKMMTDDQAG